MANEVTITFEGDLRNVHSKFEIFNGCEFKIDRVALSGKTALFPIKWDRVGSGSDKFYRAEGENTETVYLHFDAFKQGEKVEFTEVDLDFSGGADDSAKDTAVPVGCIEGTRVLVLTESKLIFTGEFKVNNGKMQAVIPIVPESVYFHNTYDANEDSDSRSRYS